ncbi:SHD1-domain-containing protein [Microthyrium microscopicum]|uniref:SHD1-domain-containing protein n=1 Tax=Microthyrium microscopicum TaxID=703497 RepID=A0A6A6UDP4_9PEZI|nr:SHD1-domain-containing protein [Microthyrium microscopicum]
MAVTMSTPLFRESWYSTSPYHLEETATIAQNGVRRFVGHVWTDKSHTKRKSGVEIAHDSRNVINLNDSPSGDDTPRAKKRQRIEYEMHEVSNDSLVEPDLKDIKVPSNPADSTKMRIWTDRSLVFKVTAELIGTRDDSAMLFKSNGVRITVPFRKLSVTDLEYIETQTALSLDEHKATVVAYQSRRTQTYARPTGDLRIWTDVSGRYTTIAKYLDLKDGKLHLHKENGWKITVPLERISMADVEFVRATRTPS